jgi:tetratricopeptide (TPR) repeat protein
MNRYMAVLERRVRIVYGVPARRGEKKGLLFDFEGTVRNLGVVFILIIVSTSLLAQTKDKTLQEYDTEGTKYLDANEFDKAIAVFNNGLNTYPNSPLLFSGLAYTYYRKGSFDIAISFCTKAINHDRYNERPYRYLGYIYYDKKDFTRAAEYFTHAIALDSTKYGTYQFRGRCYNFLGQYRNAVKDFEKAIELGSSSADTYVLLAAALYGEQDYSRAVSLANRALEIDPDNVAAKRLLKAIEEYGISIDEDGTSAVEIQVHMGWTMTDYLSAFPYLLANSLNSLIDERSIGTGKLFTYTFDPTTKRLSLAVLEDYSSQRSDRFNAYLTEWIRDNAILEELNRNGIRVVINKTPIYQDDELAMYKSLAITENRMAVLFSMEYR